MSDITTTSIDSKKGASPYRLPIIILSILSILGCLLGMEGEDEFGLARGLVPAVGVVLACIIQVLSLLALLAGKGRGTFIIVLVMFLYVLYGYLSFLM